MLIMDAGQSVILSFRVVVRDDYRLEVFELRSPGLRLRRT
jgi:hypothetical protein